MRRDNFKRVHFSRTCNSLPVNKIDKREDVTTWTWRLNSSRDFVISEKAEACMFSAITIWLAPKNELNNPNQDFIASSITKSGAKADSVETDSNFLKFEKVN